MKSKTERRSDALSKERIVEAAIDILDTDGESALTFRALSARLATGAGAIYWHVADKNELLAATADAIIGRVTMGTGDGAAPREAIRAIALGVFDAITARPWVGAQLAREPWQAAMLQIFESLGGQIKAVGVPEHAQFDAASALLNFILGVAGQNAAAARLEGRVKSRADFLAGIAAQWTARDKADYPFMHQVAAQLRDHDDREQFVAGIELILAGIGAIE